MQATQPRLTTVCQGCHNHVALNPNYRCDYCGGDVRKEVRQSTVKESLTPSVEVGAWIACLIAAVVGGAIVFLAESIPQQVFGLSFGVLAYTAARAVSELCRISAS